MKAAVAVALLLLTTFAVSADDSLGKSLVNAVVAGDVAQTRQLLDQWRPTGRKWSSDRYHAIKDLLAERGATMPWKPSPILMIFFGVMMAVFFVAFMTGIFFLDARMTGWHALSQRFPASSEPATVNKRQNGGVGLIGLVQLRNLLRAAATNEGLYMAFPKMLSAGHAPLLIPWSQLHITDDKTIFGMRVLTLHAGAPKIARVMLRGGIAPQVADRLQAIS